MLEGAKARWVYHPKLNLQLDPKSQEGLGYTSVKLQDLSFFGVKSPGSNESGRMFRGYLTARGYSKQTITPCYQ